MRARGIGAAAVSVTAVALLSACGSSGTPDGVTSEPAAPSVVEPRAQLAARAAAAKDRRYLVGYLLNTQGRTTRSVLVTVAADDSWRVDIPGGALGGGRDIAIAGRPEGQYQCTLDATASCVRVAALGKKLPAAVDPRVQYPFTGWLDALLDRQVPLSVAIVDPLPGSSGACFAVEPAVTAVQPAIDAGVLCYSDDGMLTAARFPFGTLTIAGQPTPPPPTVVLPGPVANTPPLPTAAPSAPAPSRS